MVVLVLFLLIYSFSFVSGQTPGCYIYPQGSEDLYCVEGVLDTEAQSDCDENSDCSIGQHFVPGSSCSEFPQCEEITCTIDCQIHARGFCEQLGGSEVPEDQFSLWCSPGCCQIADKFCQFNLNRFQCEDKAVKLGVSPDDAIYDNSLGMNTDTCNQLYCGVDVAKAGLSGTVKDENGAGIGGAEVSLEGTGNELTTDASGTYAFPILNPGTYLVKVTAATYLSTSSAISLLPGEQVVKNIVLVKPVGVGTLQGDVLGQDNNPIASATISWSGPANGQMQTDAAGAYTIPNLPIGTYIVIASKVGFQPQQKNVVITSNTATTQQFQLTSTVFQGVQGKTFLDYNKNNQLDGDDEYIYGAKIYIDNVFKGFSKFTPTGEFKFSLSSGEHAIYATYQDFSVEPLTTDVIGGTAVTINLPLTQFIGECAIEPKNVLGFSAGHVQGKEEVLLRWTKPCPDVYNYVITKYQNNIQVAQFTVSPSETSHLDANVAWSETYRYEIIAVYNKQQSETPAAASITLGDEECEERYSELTGWDLFCSIEGSMRKSILSCNNENKLAVAEDCSQYDGIIGEKAEVWFCAEIGEHNAVCKDAGECSLFFQAADPFGLHYTRNKCYNPETSEAPEDTGAASYCYYDYTDSTVNQCRQCDIVTSCFDYQSKDACQVNNCLGTECQWVGSASVNPLLDYGALFFGLNIPATVTPETGAGYCTEVDYSDDDKCSLCGQQGDLFENYYCTDQVCSSLGACFSNSVTVDKPLSYCAACGDEPTSETNCYTYQFESECTGGQNLEKNDRQEITFSKDQCGWERCVWDGIEDGPGTCIKDGDGNLEDDCASFANAGERIACRKDNTAPTTKVISQGQAILSLGTPNITFQAEDAESPLGAVGYCLTSASAGNPGICTNFMEKTYPGRLKDETVSVNILESLQADISGETYVLKYYTKDKYLNQEKVQTAFVYIDNVPPQFEINQEIDTAGDQTALSVYLEGTNEPMECSFTLQQILPAGAAQTKVIGRTTQKKEAAFKDLFGIRFSLNVTCEDDQGNKNNKQKDYTFDIEERIKITKPELYGVVASTSVEFEAETVSGSSCDLYLSSTNQKVAEFISDEDGIKHKTNPLPGFIEKEYAGDYKIICTELFSEEVYEEFFHFSVDFSAPSTKIILKEGARTSMPKRYGWEEYFIRFASVNFECPNEGFECDKTFYCLGERCESIDHTGYKEYHSTISINESSKICYYSTDIADNPVYQPVCGNIRIEGYGITLEHPSEYRYLDEKWGVSNTDVFTLQFLTKVPTLQCKFDFTPGFDYESIPPYKVLSPNAEGRYVIENFPTAVFSEYPENGGSKQLYMKCKNAEGEQGPEQKITLEYDPTAPVIESASAEPDMILEGITTVLSVETDDKTLCRYSDNSEGAGSDEYGTMEYSFPGAEESKLDTEHQDIFTINFVGARKEYLFNIQCKNGAGDVSGVEEIGLTVDYAALGSIASITPNGYIRQKNVTLVVQTSKKALCEYKPYTEYIVFPSGANTNIHSAPLGALQEKRYSISVRCTIGDHSSEAAASFTVDLSPPSIKNVNDGTYTCGSSEMNIMVSSDEENISAYYYEVYDTGGSRTFVPLPGNASTANVSLSNGSFSRPSTSWSNSLILNATVGPGLPLRIPTENLVEGHSYVAKVLAIDGAGNVAVNFVQGDGFTTTSASYPACQNDTGSPGVILVINDSLPESCTSTPAELQCEDATGCTIVYGKASSAGLCRATLPYNGQKILFESSGWLCYAVKDSTGNNHTGAEKITLSDADGDKVLDSCDQCPGTKAGKVADDTGCARGQIPLSERLIDNDKDGLPNVWEKTFDQLACDFSYTSPDSNNDGLSDALEDYDNDGYNSNEEYMAELDPCLADAPVGGEAAPEIPATGKTPITYTLAWIFLLLGAALVLGGTGYLAYLYRYAPRGQRTVRPTSTLRPAIVSQPRKVLESWAQKLASLRREREGRAKERARRQVFGEFSRESAQIPHLEPLLRTSGDYLSKVGTAAKKYSEHKEIIKPGLRPEEKGVFAKLEQITKQAEKKSIKEIVDADEAKEIFNKLRQLSKKRKE